MEQQQTTGRLTLESNLDQLAQELHQLAGRIKQPEQHQQHEHIQCGQGNYLVATGRS